MSDHCHTHGWVRGVLCVRCNALMAMVDRQISPRDESLLLHLSRIALAAHTARCPDCEPSEAESLRPAASRSQWGTASATVNYKRIMADLQAQIGSGALPPHQQIPTTAELAERYGVSRYTVRQAVMLLLETGVLYGQRGSGVFVAPKRPKPH